MTRTTRVILALSLAAIFLGATASAASATRTLTPTSTDYGNRQIGTPSPAQAFTLRVRCTLVVFPTTKCLQDTFSPSISITVGQFVQTDQFVQTNNCPATMTGLATKPGVDPQEGETSCTINVTFTPTSTGPKPGTLRTGSGGPTAELSGNGVTTPTPPTPPTPGPPPPPEGEPQPGFPALQLDLDAKKQKLQKPVPGDHFAPRLTFFATTNVDSTLVAGGSIKQTTKQLEGSAKTKINARLKSSARKKLAKRLDKKGKAKAKVEASAASETSGTAIEEIKVKLKG
jgi:hypothetical protein